jgi:hypothetical protein
MLSLVVLAGLPAASFAAFSSGSTGADLDFTPTVSTTLQVPDSGVFNFGMVNIPTGVTITFKRNATNTPVTILATGDVTISGTISVNGSDASANTPGAGGPGGFDGGFGGNPNVLGSRGQGPGGGGGGLTNGLGGSGGGVGFGVAGSTNGCGLNCIGSSYYCVSGYGSGGASYGNPSMIPLIGGSGGGGGAGVTNVSGGGGGGGGAILIASSGTIKINSAGSITAKGGNGAYAGSYLCSAVGGNCGGNSSLNAGGGGSGGAIRLVANVITGEGTITATGGGSPYINATCSQYTYIGGAGGDGRIRLEAWTNSRISNSTPIYTSSSSPISLYPPTVPSLAITQVNGQNVSATPSGALRAPDVILPFNTPTPVTVTVSAANVPLAGGKTVTVKALPESGNNVITVTGTLTGTDSASSTQVSLAISSAMSYVLSASVNY